MSLLKSNRNFQSLEIILNVDQNVKRSWASALLVRPWLRPYRLDKIILFYLADMVWYGRYLLAKDAVWSTLDDDVDVTDVTALACDAVV